MISIKGKVVIYNDFPKKGISFLDLNPILMDETLRSEIVYSIAEEFVQGGYDVIAGVESRGLIWASLVAAEVGAPLLLVRKKGKLPGEVVRGTSLNEYSEETLEVQKIDLNGASVLLIDDIHATGGTLETARELIKQLNVDRVKGTVVADIGIVPMKPWITKVCSL